MVVVVKLELEAPATTLLEKAELVGRPAAAALLEDEDPAATDEGGPYPGGGLPVTPAGRP